MSTPEPDVFPCASDDQPVWCNEFGRMEPHLVASRPEIDVAGGPEPSTSAMAGQGRIEVARQNDSGLWLAGLPAIGREWKSPRCVERTARTSD
jgi:hypothetical protein